MIEVQRRNGALVQSELQSEDDFNYIIDGYDKLLVEQNNAGVWVEKYVIENYEPPTAEDVEEVYQRCLEFEAESGEIIYTSSLTNGQFWVEHKDGSRSEWGSGYIYKCISALVDQGRLRIDAEMWTLEICR